jgi:tetratricopeptide (TPR) repeat protein
MTDSNCGGLLFLPAYGHNRRIMSNPISISPKLSQTPQRVTWWMLLLLALAAIGIYANSVGNDFAYDDLAIVRDSQHVVNLEWTAIWGDNYWPHKDGYPPDILYRPFTIWTYLANQALTPGATWAFHFTNVLLHALVVVMVTILTWRLLGNRAIAALSGLLFALHPIHTEVVANTVGRAEMLAAIWSLAAILIYLPEEPLTVALTPMRRPWWHGVLVAVCFFGAMLSKETPVTLIGGFALIDAWRWAHWLRETRPTLARWFGGQAVRYYLPVGIFFGIYLAMRIHATGLMRDIRTVHPLVNSLVSATPVERLVTPFLLFAKYLGLTFWPAVLSADYSFPSVMPTANPLQPLALIGILVTVLTAVLMVRYRKTAGPLLLVVGLFAMSYALVSNFLRIGTIMGERLFYLPSVFVLMLVAWGVVKMWGSNGLQRIQFRRAGIAAVVIAACAGMFVRTVVRNRDWHDNINLALATGANNPESAKACYWAGVMLVGTAHEKWMVDYGGTLLKRALTLCTNYGDIYWELAKYYGHQDDLVNSVINVTKASRYSAGNGQIRFAFSALCEDLRRNPTSRYLPQLTAYRDQHEGEPEAHLAMALVLRSQKKFDEAEKECLKAVEIDPNFHEAASQLAWIRFDAGKTDEGVDTLRKYVMRVNMCFEARCELAKALMDLDHKTHPGAFAEAQHNIDRATEISPGTVVVRQLQADLRKKIVAAGAGMKKTADGKTVAAVSPPAASVVAMGGSR